MRIILEKYNPAWRDQFEIEKELLLKILSVTNFQIEHIGSTAVAGLGAKPIIDIMIGLENFIFADSQIEKIERLGYNYISKYEDIMPYRRFFIKENKGIRTHHLHMVGIGTEFWERHLRFRDYLRMHKAYRDEYYRLKKKLARKEWKDGDEYAEAKSEFIKKIEEISAAPNTRYS